MTSLSYLIFCVAYNYHCLMCPCHIFQGDNIWWFISMDINDITISKGLVSSCLGDQRFCDLQQNHRTSTER